MTYKPAEPVKTVEPAAQESTSDTALVKEIRHWSNTGYTRVVIDLGGKATFKASRIKRPDRLVFDIKKGTLEAALIKAPVTINDGILKTIRASQYNADTVRVVLDLESIADYRTLMLPDPQRMVIDVEGKRAAVAKRSGHGRVISLKSARNEGPAPVLEVTTTVAPPKCPAKAGDGGLWKKKPQRQWKQLRSRIPACQPTQPDPMSNLMHSLVSSLLSSLSLWQWKPPHARRRLQAILQRRSASAR